MHDIVKYSLMFKNAITMLVISAVVILLEATSMAASEARERIHIRGIIRTKDGLRMKDIKVTCFYLSKADFPYEFGRQVSDNQGRYEFEVRVGLTCWIEAGGRKSTHTASKRFTTRPQTDVSIEDLIVRPFSTKVEGRVVYEDGQPATYLSFGYNSESASPVDATNPPMTNRDGKFTIEHLLPDELYSFWVFTEPNIYRVWKRLDPNTPTLQLTLRKRDCVELPKDWLYGGYTHEAIARNMVYAEDSSVEFKLPDLSGNVFALSDERFKNKAVIVNIMGTWCGGCHLEAPYLVEYYNRYKEKGLEVVSIAFEREPKEEAIDAITAFKHKYNINYTLLYGGSSNRQHVESIINGLKLFGGYPTTIYIDCKKKVQFIHAGFWIHTKPHKTWQLDLMEKHIHAILSDDN